MKIINTKNLSIENVLKELQIDRSEPADVEFVVRNILSRVKRGGDEVLIELTEKFDGFRAESLKISRSEIEKAYQNLDASVIDAIKFAKANIEKFHKINIRWKEEVVETVPGVQVWREFRPVEKVGLYVPGGTAAYPSTVLMLAVPAKIAQCEEIVICTPAGGDGQCNPAVLVAADLCGITEIYKVGGAQAIAAMAFGTESIPKVCKIFGPGNQYVATAKMIVSSEGLVGIDMLAGPSEICVIADGRSNSSWVAADLLSQLEHGGDSQAVLITFSEEFAGKVIESMKKQTELLSRKEIIKTSFKRSFAVVVNSIDEAVEVANGYAAEHLEVIFEDEETENSVAARVNNVGSVFLGPFASEPLGDYATGSNHTLPTSGFASLKSPLSAESFGKMIQMQRVTQEGIGNLKESVTALAYIEGLQAHARAVEIRFED